MFKVIAAFLVSSLSLTTVHPVYSQQITETATTQNNGMLIAWGTLIGMVLALVVTIIILGMAFSGKKILPSLPWLEAAIPVLGLVGLGVALYMLYVEATPANAICGPIGDCNSVQESPYARIMGWLPVGLAGVMGYLAIFAAWWWGKRRKTGWGAMMPVILLGFSAFGTLYSIYLTYLEIFVIQAVCMWCITSAIVMTLILLANLPRAAAWLTFSEEDQP